MVLKVILNSMTFQTSQRLELLARFPDTTFPAQLSPTSPAVRMCAKNAKISSALREKANLMYAQGEEDAALQLYNQSLQFCPQEDGEEESGVAFLYDNRSAVWANRGSWAMAIRDVDLALEVRLECL